MTEATTWGSTDQSVVGQLVEFLVWLELEAQSRGQLHVYLPLWDRGIDAVIHRRTDGVYIPVQVKGRSKLFGGEVKLAVWATSLVDDQVLLIGAWLDGDRLGRTLLVVEEAIFKRLAMRSHNRDKGVYLADFGMHPRRGGRWFPYLVPKERLAERLGVPAAQVAAEVMPVPVTRVPTEPATGKRDPGGLGSLGELEVLRRLAEMEVLNLFRPFPDLETVEIVVRNVRTHRILGVQVKTIGLDPRHPDSTVVVRRSSFRPAPDTWIVVLGWLRDERRFHAECLIMPSADLESVSAPEGNALRFHYHPGGTGGSRVDPYRRQLAGLGPDLADLLGAQTRISR